MLPRSPDLPRLLRDLVSGVVLLQPDIRVVGDELTIPAGAGSELRVVAGDDASTTYRADAQGVIHASRAAVAVARRLELCRVRFGRLRCRPIELRV